MNTLKNEISSFFDDAANVAFDYGADAVDALEARLVASEKDEKKRAFIKECCEELWRELDEKLKLNLDKWETYCLRNALKTSEEDLIHADVVVSSSSSRKRETETLDQVGVEWKRLRSAEWARGILLGRIEDAKAEEERAAELGRAVEQAAQRVASREWSKKKTRGKKNKRSDDGNEVDDDNGDDGDGDGDGGVEEVMKKRWKEALELHKILVALKVKQHQQQQQQQQQQQGN